MIKELFDKDFVILDTETTGLNLYSNDEVVELGIVNKFGEIIYKSRFKPKRIIDQETSQINGLTNKLLENEPFFKDEWSKILNELKDKIIVIHSVAFDKKVIQSTLKRYGIYHEDEFNNIFKNTFDSIIPCKKYLGKAKLSVCAKLLEIKEEQAHSAIDDCLMVLNVLNKLLKIEENYKKVDINTSNKNTQVDKTFKKQKDYVKVCLKYNGNIKKIADEMSVTEGTVMDNLIKLWEKSMISVNFILPLVQSNYKKDIFNILNNGHYVFLKEIKEQLPEEVTYITIKYFKILHEKENS